MTSSRLTPASDIGLESPHRDGNPIVGTSEMARLVRAHDWTATSVGPIESWSETLVGAVNSMLNLPFASGIFCGVDNVLIYNDGYRLFLGDKHPEALGNPARSSWEEVWDFVGPLIEDVRLQGTAKSEKNRLLPIDFDGIREDRYWTYCFYPIYERGRIIAVTEVAFDSTSEVMATEKLQESEARATRILQSIGDAVIVTDAETRVTRMNPIAEALTGWTAAEAEGHSLAEVFRIVSEATRRPVESPADKVKRLGTIVGLANHTILIRKDGTETPIDDSGAPIRDSDGALSGIVVIFRDIGERRQAERALHLSEERTRLALTAANGVGTWDWDVPNDLVYADTNFARLYGVDPAIAAAGITIAEFTRNMHPGDQSRVSKSIVAALQSGDEFASEYRLIQRDGSVRWVTAVGRCTLTPDGIPLRFPGVTFDITERKLSEEALRSSEERLRMATETAQLGMWELDTASGWMDCSATCKANYGRSPSEVFNYEDLLASIHPDDRPGMQAAAREAIATGSLYRYEYRVYWPDGSLHWVVASGRVTPSPENMSKSMVGVTLDVTERHQSTAALLQSEKLAAVGRLAASIAHEINNPLESVTNLLYLARGSKDMTETQELLKVAERELHRVSVISNQTLRFHKQSTKPLSISCVELIESVLSVYQARFVNSRIQVEKRKRAEKPVLCFEGEIRQVLSNLVGNAIDAMHPNGGLLLLRSRDGTDWRTDRKGLVITVADTGSGMSAMTRKKIFEPFFTTKGIGGNGLGLWVSQEIVDRHHGTLRVYSNQREGRSGTVFSLFLPYDAVSR